MHNMSQMALLSIQTHSFMIVNEEKIPNTSKIGGGGGDSSYNSHYICGCIKVVCFLFPSESTNFYRVLNITAYGINHIVGC